MRKLFGFVAMAVVSMTVSFSAAANCDIVDILDMVDEGLSKSTIRGECNNTVADAPTCSVRKVIRLYENDGYDSDEISQVCSSASGTSFDQDQPVPPSIPQQPQAQASNICQTPQFWCALGQSAYPGTPCWCNSWAGPVNGVIVPQ